MKDEELATLYAEFADEDRRVAEDGIEDYQSGLAREDSRWKSDARDLSRVLF